MNIVQVLDYRSESIIVPWGSNYCDGCFTTIAGSVYLSKVLFLEVVVLG